MAKCILSARNRVVKLASIWVVVLVTLAVMISLTGFGQEVSAASPGAPMTLAQREKIARPLLLHAERFAPSLDPSNQALLLYRAAGAWLALDKAHAIRLYREAFASALRFEPDSLRPSVEEAILNDLLPLSPSDVLDLLPRAESKTQDRLYRAVVNFSLMQADYAAALHAFDRACESGHFSQRSATHLIAGLGDTSALVTPFRSHEEVRTHVFKAALKTYQGLDASEAEPWTASRLIAQFQTQFPAEVVLPAIDIVLAQAVKKDKASPLGSAGTASGTNSLSYNSRYDIELFAVAPALERFDPVRATSLVNEHPQAAEYLKRFPGGLPSFDVIDFHPSNYPLRRFSSEHIPTGLQLYNSEIGAHSTGLSPMDMGLEFTIPLDLRIGLGVTGSGDFFANPDSPESEIYKKSGRCPDDVGHILTLTSSVPFSRNVARACSGPNGQWCSYEEEFPRADLLQAIAQGCTDSRNDATAQVVLHKQMELISQMEPEHQTGYLATAADLYLRLDEKENAAMVVRQGFATANTLLQHDLAAVDLKEVPNVVWAAAETYRRMITLGVNASISSTQAMVEQITDPSLREYEEIMVARALLGVPVRRYMVKFRNGSLLTGEVDVSYDRF